MKFLGHLFLTIAAFILGFVTCYFGWLQPVVEWFESLVANI